LEVKLGHHYIGSSKSFSPDIPLWDM